MRPSTPSASSATATEVGVLQGEGARTVAPNADEQSADADATVRADPLSGTGETDTDGTDAEIPHDSGGTEDYEVIEL